MAVRACAMHPAIIIRTVRSLAWLWGRYHVPQNAFLVRERNYMHCIVVFAIATCDTILSSKVKIANRWAQCWNCRTGRILGRVFVCLGRIYCHTCVESFGSTAAGDDGAGGGVAMMVLIVDEATQMVRDRHQDGRADTVLYTPVSWIIQAGRQGHYCGRSSSQ